MWGPAPRRNSAASSILGIMQTLTGSRRPETFMAPATFPNPNADVAPTAAQKVAKHARTAPVIVVRDLTPAAAGGSSPVDSNGAKRAVTPPLVGVAPASATAAAAAADERHEVVEEAEESKEGAGTGWRPGGMSVQVPPRDRAGWASTGTVSGALTERRSKRPQTGSNHELQRAHSDGFGPEPACITPFGFRDPGMPVPKARASNSPIALRHSASTVPEPISLAALSPDVVYHSMTLREVAPARHWRWIIDPHSVYKISWDSLIAVFILFSVITIPLRISFDTVSAPRLASRGGVCHMFCLLTLPRWSPSRPPGQHDPHVCGGRVCGRAVCD